jgi:hypothetical protein
MKNLTYESYLADPQSVQERIQREARRSRAQALNRALFEPLAAFCGRLLAVRGIRLRLDPRQAVAQ